MLLYFESAFLTYFCVGMLCVLESTERTIESAITSAEAGIGTALKGAEEGISQIGKTLTDPEQVGDTRYTSTQ
jgi:hypothetical protein